MNDKNFYRLLNINSIKDKNDVAMDISWPDTIILEQNVQGGNIYGDIVNVPSGSVCNFDTAINDDGITLGVYKCGNYNILVTKDEATNGYIFTVKDANNVKDKNDTKEEAKTAYNGSYAGTLSNPNGEEIIISMNNIHGKTEYVGMLFNSSGIFTGESFVSDHIYDLMDMFKPEGFTLIEDANSSKDKNYDIGIYNAIIEYLNNHNFIELIGDSFNTEEFLDFIASKTGSMLVTYSLSDVENALDQLVTEGKLSKDYVPSGIIYDKNKNLGDNKMRVVKNSNVKDKNDTTVGSNGTGGSNPAENPFAEIFNAIDSAEDKPAAYRAIINKLISDSCLSTDQVISIITLE